MTTPELEAIRCEMISIKVYSRLCHAHLMRGLVKTHGPKLSSLLTDGTGDGGSLHLTLVVDDNTGIVLEVQEDTVGAAPGLALTDDNGGHDLLAQLGLTLLDGGHDHVTDTSSGQTVQAGTGTGDGNDVQVASTGVVAAVHHGATNRRRPLVFS